MEASVPSSVKKKKNPIDENSSPAGVSEGNSEGLDLMEATVVPTSVAENEYILTEILSKLPRKSRRKFVCVSKQWLAIIESSYFEELRQNYRRRMRPNLGLLYGRGRFLLLGKEDDDTLSRLYLPESLERRLDHNLEIVGSQNGLVCLSQFECETKFFVWNPATRQHRELPLPLSFEGENVMRSPVLGFGFSNNSTDYKVVSITESLHPDDNGKFCYYTQVFTRGQNSWREIEGCIPSGNYNFYPGHTVSVNGVFYWLAKSNAYEIFALNLHDEVFHKISLPSDRFIEQGYIRLYPWKKSIAIRARNTLNSKTAEINVWLMTQDHSKDDDDQWNWTKLFTIKKIGGVLKRDVFGVCNDEFVYDRLHSKGNKRNKSLCAYNPATKMERKIINNIKGSILSTLRCRKVENYVESEVSVF